MGPDISPMACILSRVSYSRVTIWGQEAEGMLACFLIGSAQASKRKVWGQSAISTETSYPDFMGAGAGGWGKALNLKILQPVYIS